jgi:3-oxoadipate enol-lactonase
MLIETKYGMLDVEQEGRGRDLVLLHSLLADRTAFDLVRPALARNHKLWLVNLPGYGKSSPVESTVDEYADLIADLMKTLNLPQRTDVLGNGLGGFISLALAVRHGEKFDRLIVADALAAFPEPGKEALRVLAKTVKDKGMAAGLDAAIQRMFPPSFIQGFPEIVNERKKGLLQMDPSIFSRLCIALTQVNFAPHLSRIRNPTLVMAGAMDGTTIPELVSKLADGIPGARFIKVPDCGHCPQIEQPQVFVKLVSDFLPTPQRQT